MSDHCGSVTEEGTAVCVPGSCSCSPVTKDSGQISIPVSSKTNTNEQEAGMWKKIRSGLMFGVACITSPCCTPLIVPLGLALFAGTPVAIWLSAHIGWVYGGLTLLSIVSLVLGFRWLGQKNEARRKTNSQAINKVHAS